MAANSQTNRNQVKKVRHFILSIFTVVFCSVLLLLGQEGAPPPPKLNVTDWILGNPNDVGEWGDGKIYLLDFWGTWCAPCIKEIPHLSRLQDEYREKGFVVIGYSWEKPEILHRFVRKMGSKMRYVVVSDTTERTLKAYTDEKLGDDGIQGFPYSYLISASGKIVWRGHPKSLSTVLATYFAGE